MKIHSCFGCFPVAREPRNRVPSQAFPPRLARQHKQIHPRNVEGIGSGDVSPPGVVKSGSSLVFKDHLPPGANMRAVPATGSVASPEKLQDESAVRARVDKCVQTEGVAFETVLARNPVGPPSPDCSRCDNEHSACYSSASIRFSSQELNDMTENFSVDCRFNFRDDENLYTGSLDGRQIFVTRKEKDFSIEVDILKCLRHPNIVFLIGYCDEVNSRALVFNFICNRTLFFHLTNGTMKPMRWSDRANLAVKLAECLGYLHNTHIIHGSVNSMNVFVTHDFKPVLGDFSFSRNIDALGNILLQDRSADKRARGYLPPEYEVGKKLSEKQDIYGFGVILFELVSGRPAFDRDNKINHLLGEWGRNTVNESDPTEPCQLLGDLQDKRLMASIFNKCDMLRMVRVAAICTSEDPNKRPSMHVVLQMLTGNIDFQSQAPADPEPASQEAGADQDTLPTQSGSALPSLSNEQTSLSNEEISLSNEQTSLLDLFQDLETTCKNSNYLKSQEQVASTSRGSWRPQGGLLFLARPSTPFPSPRRIGFSMSPRIGKGVVIDVPFNRTSGGANSEIGHRYRVRFAKEKQSSGQKWRERK